MTTLSKTEYQGREQVRHFVAYVYDRKEKDHGFRARMRRALSPTQAAQVWGDLVPFVDISKSGPRMFFTLLGASIALEKGTESGRDGLGRVLFLCSGSAQKAGDSDDGPNASRLRRLVACQSSESLCRNLKPLLTLIRSRCPGQLDYVRLLDELLSFEYDDEKIKARWIKEFYAPFDKEDQ